MEAPASLVFAWCFFRGPQAFEIVPLLLFALWQAHYAHRAFVYPFQLRAAPGATMALVPVVLGALYCTVNGYLNGTFTSTYGSHLTAAWLADPRFASGVFLYVVGYAINKQSDRILRSLRPPGETGYRIPYGGGYRWVSSPNYLGEIVTWSGFALASWSLAGVSFVAMTAANLVPRALSNHRWYRETFADYPADRKAILPWVL